MSKIIMFIIFTFFSCCHDSCLKDDDLKENKSKNAGAVIIDCFDLTEHIIIKRNHLGIWKYYDLAQYNDIIYIRIERTLHIFEKNSMQKIKELNIILPKEYSYLPSDTGGLASGLAVIGNNAFVLFRDSQYASYKTQLFSIDLNSGVAQYIDEKLLGFHFNKRPDYIDEFTGSLSDIVGYDSMNNMIWFRVVEYSDKTNPVIFYTFRYNAQSNTFTLIGKKEWGYEASLLLEKNNKSINGSMWLNGSSIYGNESWNVYFYSQPIEDPKPSGGGTGAFTTILDKRNIDYLTKTIKLINIELLGFHPRIPLQTCIYDPPYIWIMVDHNEKILMLKLLPNE